MNMTPDIPLATSIGIVARYTGNLAPIISLASIVTFSRSSSVIDAYKTQKRKAEADEKQTALEINQNYFKQNL